VTAATAVITDQRVRCDRAGRDRRDPPRSCGLPAPGPPGPAGGPGCTAPCCLDVGAVTAVIAATVVSVTRHSRRQHGTRGLGGCTALVPPQRTALAVDVTAVTAVIAATVVQVTRHARVDSTAPAVSVLLRADLGGACYNSGN
jgi:hypothetical protein